MALSGTLDLELDDGLGFAFTVTNTGSEPIELRYRDGQRAEFLVLDGGAERWRWSDGRLFPQVLGSERLAGGESISYEGRWEEPVAGSYTVRATLCAEETDCAVEGDFELSGENLSFDPS